jgi:hypothetical protein
MKMGKPKVITNPVANQYASKDERIIEYSSDGGGGLIAFRVVEGRLIIDLYRHDNTVEIRVGKPDVAPHKDRDLDQSDDQNDEEPVSGVGIEIDDDFDLKGFTDSDSLQRETEEKLASGEWAVYRTVVTRGHERVPDWSHALHGTVADAGFDGWYSKPEEIRHEYLRSVAQELLSEAVEGQ